MQKMSWLRQHWFLISIYITFTICSVIFGSKKILYANVAAWPSVSAKNVDSEFFNGEIRVDSRYYGTKSSSVRSESVFFNYVVGGKTYEGKLATPDGGDLLENMIMKLFLKKTERANASPSNSKAMDSILSSRSSSVAVLHISHMKALVTC